MNKVLIYLRIIGKSAECWTPAMAVCLSDDTYRIVQLLSEDQAEFRVGDTVRGEVRGFPDGSEALLAVERTAPN